jgi:mono/diheme cytochrome c family protein
MTRNRRFDFASPLAALATAGLVAFAAACGSDDKDDKTPAASPSPSPAPALTFADVKSIVDANCVSCHSTYGTKAGLDPEAASSLARIALAPTNNQAMPSGKTGSTPFDQTTDGAKLKSYLETVD